MLPMHPASRGTTQPRTALVVAFAAAVSSGAAASSRGDEAAWPATLQPFFLSALSETLTRAEAEYIGRFPLAVINHKQGSREHGEPALLSRDSQSPPTKIPPPSNLSC